MRNQMNERSLHVGQRFRICRDPSMSEPARNDGQKRKQSRRSGAPSKNPRVAFETAIARGASGYLRVVNTINPCVPCSQIFLAFLRGPAAQFLTSPPRLLKVVPRKPITERKI